MIARAERASEIPRENIGSRIAHCSSVRSTYDGAPNFVHWLRKFWRVDSGNSGLHPRIVSPRCFVRRDGPSSVSRRPRSEDPDRRPADSLILVVQDTASSRDGLVVVKAIAHFFRCRSLPFRLTEVPGSEDLHDDFRVVRDAAERFTGIFRDPPALCYGVPVAYL